MSEKIWAAVSPYILPICLAMFGAMVRRAHEVREGRTMRFFDWTLPLDLFLSTPGVLFGSAANEQLGLTGHSAAVVIFISGYAGWRALMVWFAKRQGIDVDLGVEKKESQ